MTPQERYLRDKDVAKAFFEEGRECQHHHISWSEGYWERMLDGSTLFNESFTNRIKPTPQLVPWDRIEDVPLGWTLQRRASQPTEVGIINGYVAGENNELLGVSYGGWIVNIGDISECTCSPNGKTDWQACLKEAR